MSGDKMNTDAPLRPEDAPPSLYDENGNARFFSDPGMDRFVAVSYTHLTLPTKA